MPFKCMFLFVVLLLYNFSFILGMLTDFTAFTSGHQATHNKISISLGSLQLRLRNPTLFCCHEIIRSSQVPITTWVK